MEFAGEIMHYYINPNLFDEVFYEKFIVNYKLCKKLI